MHYYQFNIGDYSRRTKYLDHMEDLAYRRLLDQYYLKEEPYQLDNVEEIAREIGMRDQLDAVRYVLIKFFPEGRNRHADKEIAKYQEKSAKAKAAIAKRWETYERNTDVIQTKNEPNTNQEPITNNQEPIKDNSKRADRLPFTSRRVMELYNNIMANTYARKKKAISESTSRRINTLTKNEFKTEEDWIEFFTALTRSDFLMGKTETRGRRPFQLSLEWCIKEENIIKIIEGAYHG